MSALNRHIHDALAEQEAKQLRRIAPSVEHRQGLHYTLQGKEVLSFCSNDFLGYGAESFNDRNAARTGSGASRLVHGNHLQIRSLEQQFAAAMGYEDAILFPSGYQANIAGLAQLPVPAQTVVYSDAYNHASIIDGLRLRSTNKIILPHLQRPPSANQWWVSESRYSMDGDGPTADQLDAHLEDGGYLYLDEAHRFGLEARGQGLNGEMRHRPQLANYPLGKAFGQQGAFLAGDKSNTDWVRQFSRAYTYTTAASPLTCGLVTRRMDQLFGEDGDSRRRQLQKNLAVASEALEQSVTSPILSILIGDNRSALDASNQLLQRGYHVQAIRPPTVPKGSARLRVTFSALHSPTQIQSFVEALQKTTSPR